MIIIKHYDEVKTIIIHVIQVNSIIHLHTIIQVSTIIHVYTIVIQVNTIICKHYNDTCSMMLSHTIIHYNILY